MAKVVKIVIILAVLVTAVAIIGDDELRASLIARVKGTAPEDNPVDT